MINDDMDAGLYRKLLESIDGPGKYRPEGFVPASEDKRAHSLGADIERAIRLRVLIEDYSLNQDGSRFVKIRLFERSTVADAGEIVISSFGDLATMENIQPAHQDMMVTLLEAAGYVYIPLAVLEGSYSGKHIGFVGETWYYRFFAPWFRA